ncbi:hypothetical protein CsSME_00023750 [Camellia sinensis var. sinensis]|uniref:probable WRKY transcription factor 53 n=1 Tax=Camellia sinensis TaxID=4442 RepID=UPI001036AC6B|nr:probable WRKY transcription factor 53 [Camellia sinensis]
MEKLMTWEQERLINELNQGRELTKQLKNHLDPSASPESREFLIQKILSCYERSISMLNWGALVGELHKVDGTSETPQSQLAGHGSPMTDASDKDFKDQCHRDVYKKRKTLPRWTQQVSVCSGTGLGALDDGYCWRKYGQKDILGANFPRAYYRCTHRNAQGCLATKQVQRSDEDSSIFEITYRGRHTCIQTSQVTPSLAPIRKDCPKQNKYQPQPHQEEENQSCEFETEKVKTAELGIVKENFPSFSFPSAETESENVETNIFPDSLKEKNFLASDSPAFVSPETSESDYFSMLPIQMENFEFFQNLRHSESDLAEIMSARTSVSNSPTIAADLDFPLGFDFDPNFTFDTSEFFA